jgi:hypothetical protein
LVAPKRNNSLCHLAERVGVGKVGVAGRAEEEMFCKTLFFIA